MIRRFAASTMGFVLSTFAVAELAGGAEVRVERLDGTTFDAIWGGVKDGGRIAFRTADAFEYFDEGVANVDFAPPGQAAADALAATSSYDSRLRGVNFFFADGGSAFGELLGKSPDALLSRTSLGDGLLLPFSRLAGIQFVPANEFPRAAEMFRAAMGSRLPGLDVLITRSPDEPKSVRGRLEGMDASEGLFAPGERAAGKDPPRTFATEKVFGVIFAAGVNAGALFPVTMRLTDGTSVSGKLLAGEDDEIRMDTSLGVGVRIPLNRVRSLALQSSRLVFLSDLPVNAERTEGRLHRPWAPRMDRNVAAGPLTLDGREYRKGIGVHSRTELEYELQESFETFAATIGIDDAVRPRGSVVFRVLGDSGAVLFDSGLITGKDPSRTLAVALSSVRRLTLVTDYGDDLDLSDYADWSGARLIRPAAKAP